MPKRRETILFSLTCQNNLGGTQKHLKKYEEALQTLEAGIEKILQLHQEIDRKFEETTDPDELDTPEMKTEIAKSKYFPLLRRMKYHKIGCLQSLGREEEAQTLAKKLLYEAHGASDYKLEADLKKDGYGF